jgi:hypothetical protein
VLAHESAFAVYLAEIAVIFKAIALKLSPFVVDMAIVKRNMQTKMLATKLLAVDFRPEF